jgi:hypothetical protein
MSAKEQWRKQLPGQVRLRHNFESKLVWRRLLVAGANAVIPFGTRAVEMNTGNFMVAGVAFAGDGVVGYAIGPVLQTLTAVVGARVRFNIRLIADSPEHPVLPRLVVTIEGDEVTVPMVAVQGAGDSRWVGETIFDQGTDIKFVAEDCVAGLMYAWKAEIADNPKDEISDIDFIDTLGSSTLDYSGRAEVTAMLPESVKQGFMRAHHYCAWLIAQGARLPCDVIFGETKAAGAQILFTPETDIATYKPDVESMFDPYWWVVTSRKANVNVSRLRILYKRWLVMVNSYLDASAVDCTFLSSNSVQ